MTNLSPYAFIELFVVLAFLGVPGPSWSTLASGSMRGAIVRRERARMALRRCGHPERLAENPMK
jgi:hypothetical protein